MKIDSLDQRIRELCKRVAAAKDDEEMKHLIAELKLALHEHVEHMRLMMLKAANRLPTNNSHSKAAD